MDWRNLQLAVELSRTGTIAGASRRMGLTAASVAKRLERLNDELGARAFQKTAKGWLPTKEMASVLDTLLVFDDRVNQELDLLERRKNGAQKQVRVAAPAVLQMNILYPAMANFGGGDWQHKIVFTSFEAEETRDSTDLRLVAQSAAQSFSDTTFDIDIEYAMYQRAGAASLEQWVTTADYEDMLPHHLLGKDYYQTEPSVLVDDCQMVLNVVKQSNFAGALPTMIGKQHSDLVEIYDAGVARVGFCIEKSEVTGLQPEVLKVEDWLRETLSFYTQNNIHR